jgi:hypothetical protein
MLISWQAGVPKLDSTLSTTVIYSLASSQSQSHIATDGQSVSLGIDHHLGLLTGYLLLFVSYGLVFCGAPSRLLTMSFHNPSARTPQKTAYIVDEACLPRRCLVIDALLSRALACPGMCLPSRCLALGLHITILLDSVPNKPEKETQPRQRHAQAISRRLPISVARAWALFRSCGLYSGDSGTGLGFLHVFRFPLPILIPSIAQYLLDNLLRASINMILQKKRGNIHTYEEVYLGTKSMSSLCEGDGYVLLRYLVAILDINIQSALQQVIWRNLYRKCQHSAALLKLLNPEDGNLPQECAYGVRIIIISS